MDKPIKIRQLLGAAIAYVPALFVISGLKAFFVGFFPRATIGLKRYIEANEENKPLKARILYMCRTLCGYID
ncbi:hypothetical protein [Shouchella clausii]|uniref:hypothetical protein n=1 Tax=Shouchella clausii TaxID=79880 RepID=UPI00280BBF6A|nr:hypothetical protein [Shouchella clausii]WMM34019.1 hypothetical protein Q7C08_08070 [Shouchella clausii]